MPKRKCLFNDDLRKKYVSFRQGRTESEVTCLLCSCSVSIANKGKSDIEEHIRSKKHQGHLKNTAHTSKCLSMYLTKTEENAKLVAAAEATLSYHTVCHHQSYNSLNCTIAVHKKIYTDSEICKKITCARTKATSIVNNVLAPFSIRQIIKDLENIAYISVATDASNHLATKMFPLIVQYFDYQNGGIKCKLLDIIFETKEDATTISNLVADNLNKNDILSKCIAFGGIIVIQILAAVKDLEKIMYIPNYVKKLITI